MFLHWIFFTYNEKSFGIEDVYMSVAGHLSYILNILVLEESSVWASGFLLVHGMP